MFNVVAAYRNLDWNSSEAGQRIKVNTGVLTTGKWFCCPGMLTLRGGTRPSGETSCVLPPLPTSQLVMTVQLTRMLSKMLEILYPKLCRMLLHTNMCLWLYKWFLSHRGSRWSVWNITTIQRTPWICVFGSAIGDAFPGALNQGFNILCASVSMQLYAGKSELRDPSTGCRPVIWWRSFIVLQHRNFSAQKESWTLKHKLKWFCLFPPTPLSCIVQGWNGSE